MSFKRTNAKYSKEYKEEAASLITEQGYTVAKTTESRGLATDMLYKWKEKIEVQTAEQTLSSDDRYELKRL